MESVLILLAVAIIVVIRNCKKLLRKVLVIILSILAIYCVIFTIDQKRIESNKEPIFVKEITISDNERELRGLGYKVIEKYDIVDGEKRVNQMEMYFLNKCIAGVINDY